MNDLHISSRTRGLYLLITAQLAFGTAGIFARFALTGSGPLNAVFFRLALAAPLAVGLAYICKRDLRLPSSVSRRLVLAGCILGLHFVLWVTSLQYASVTVATLLVCTAPFWLLLYDVVLHRSLPKIAVLIAALIASVATAIIVKGGATAGPLGGDHALLGAGLALTAAMLVSCYMVLVRSVGKGRSSLAMTAYIYPSTLLIVAPIVLIAHQHLPSTPLSWGGILGMAVITQLIGHTALAASLRTFKSSSVAFAGLSEPPIAAVTAAIFLAEPMKAAVILGGIILLVAIGVVMAQDRDSETSQIAGV